MPYTSRRFVTPMIIIGNLFFPLKVCCLLLLTVFLILSRNSISNPLKVKLVFVNVKRVCIKRFTYLVVENRQTLSLCRSVFVTHIQNLPTGKCFLSII